jgi:hypothetical protein
MDRAYIDFERLYHLHQSGVYYFIRAKQNLAFRRRYSNPVDKSTGVRSDQSILLTGPKSSKLYPDPLRRVHHYSNETHKRFRFLTTTYCSRLRV